MALLSDMVELFGLLLLSSMAQKALENMKQDGRLELDTVKQVLVEV